MILKTCKLSLFILVVGCLRDVQSKECYSCKGINCLRTSKVTNKAECVDPMDSCITIFEKFTVIARGCYSTIPEEQRKKCDNVSDSECHKCWKSLCNDKGALSCLQCNSESNEDCQKASSKIESTRCPVPTSPNSYCYTRKTSNKIERGCLIDTSAQLKCLSDSSCEMCITDSEGACNRDSDFSSGSQRVAAYSVLLLMVWLISTLF